MTIDRRDTFRVKPATREPIRVELAGSEMLEVGQVVDISEGGTGVRLDAAQSDKLIGVELALFIEFPAVQPAYTKGVVRSIRRDGSGSVLGIEFVNLSAKTLEAIRDYVAYRGRKHSGNFRVG